jgi:hypothetical protein
MQLTFEGYDEGYGSILCCPSCGANNLHHERIDIYERVEDDSIGLHAVVTDGEVSVDNDMKGNPSMRRHGLSIRLVCECCDSSQVLHIKQHKGGTLLDMVALNNS